MEDLVNKSLARRTVTSDDITGTWYSVHNLQLTFLQEQATDLQALHKKLVDRYRKVYSGKSSKQLTLVSAKVCYMLQPIGCNVSLSHFYLKHFVRFC